MADQEYERDERLLEARRLKRLELKRKRMIRKRITLGVCFLILVILIVVIFKSCGKKQDTPQVDTPPSEPDSNQEAVSYTHLDVYKRQPDSRRSPTAICISATARPFA